MTQLTSERAWNVALRAQGETSLELTVYDVIGQDFWTGEGVTSKDILGKLRASPKATKIDLRVNSVGGLVDEAKAMVNLLTERASAGVEIVGWVDGLAASSAAYLLTAAKRVVMPSNAFQMIHSVRGGVRGTPEDLEAGAVLMRRTNEQLAEAFAAASARRGKGKTKEDFLAAFAAGDLYLDADEAIAWGLADEKLDAVKIAACLGLADLSTIEDAPAALMSAPYVTLNGAAPVPAQRTPGTVSQHIEIHMAPGANPDAVAKQLALALTPPQPIPSAREGQDNNPKPPRNPEPKTMTQAAVLNLVAIATVLGFTAEAAASADEQTITNSIKRLQGQAKLGSDLEALVGASGPAALGAVRALKASNEANAELGNKVAQLAAVNARRDFEGARDGGLKDRKLTPAVAKLYTERFEACLKNEAIDADARTANAEAVVQDLKGFLAVAPRVVAVSLSAQPASGSAGEGGAMLHSGKAFEAMSGSERKRLKDENPELYTTMREDAVARRAI